VVTKIGAKLGQLNSLLGEKEIIFAISLFLLNTVVFVLTMTVLLAMAGSQ